MNWKNFLPEEKEEVIALQVKLPASLHAKAEKKLRKQNLTWKALVMAFLKEYVSESETRKNDG